MNVKDTYEKYSTSFPQARECGIFPVWPKLRVKILLHWGYF